MSIARIVAVAVLPLTALSLIGVAIQEPNAANPSVFDDPARRQQASQLQLRLISLYAAGQDQEAADIALKIVRLTPAEAGAYYNLASLQALLGRRGEALKSLNQAVQLGFREAQQILNDNDLAVLRDESEFIAAVKAAQQPYEPAVDDPDRTMVPGKIRDGIAMVTEQNTRWISSRGALVSFFEADADGSDRDAAAGRSEAETLVRNWYREGTAAGHAGDLYDNRDRDHSPLKMQKFPQLSRVQYGPEAKRAGADWGVQIHHLFDRPTLGNSSTAQVGTPFWRSNPRLFLFSDPHTKRVYNQYVSNHLYVYPEHNDYDEKYGDVYPAHVPYCVISQGSSGSDQPFLEALALTMAAFRPAVKQQLVDHGMLMPTLQYILRRCARRVVTDDDYLSGLAHPIVFQSSDPDPLRMVELAHQLETGRLPPLVQLEVLEEDTGIAGRDYCYPGPGERLFDTPSAIARLYRSMASSRRMVVDASASRDASQLPLTFQWLLLQGDPEKVDIRPLDEAGTRAEITIRWHPRHPVAHRPEIHSNRIDIGVFASNGVFQSAPGFITSFSFDNELREYDADGRIQFIDYGDPEVGIRYVDPLLDLKKNWRDEFHYADNGRLTGWTRLRKNGAVQQFNHDGALILERDASGRPLRSIFVLYQPGPARANQPAVLETVETDRVLTYRYTSDEDRFGTAELVNSAADDP